METATRAVVSVKFMTGAVERVWIKVGRQDWVETKVMEKK